MGEDNKDHVVHDWVPINMAFVSGVYRDIFLVRYACGIEECEEEKLDHEKAEEI